MLTPACYCRASLLFCCGLLCCVFLASAQSLGLRTGSTGTPAVERDADRTYKKPKFISSSASVSRLISFSFPVSKRQSITVSTEMLRLSTFYVKTPDNSSNPDWKFRGVPVTVGYEYTLSDPMRRIVPVIGAGLSTYYCSTSHRDGAFDPALVLSQEESFSRSSGFGYGLQATMGLRGNISRNLFVQAQGRYRLIKGHAFVADTDGLSASFPLFDFAVGFGIRL